MLGEGTGQVSGDQQGQGVMDQSPPTPVASPDLSLLQCSLQLALLPFQRLLGFLQFLDALPTEADLVCEITDLLCRVNRA